MSKRVEIVLDKNGSIKAEAFGFKGSSCTDAAAFLDALYGSAENLTYKDSFWEQKEQTYDGLPAGYCG